MSEKGCLLCSIYFLCVNSESIHFVAVYSLKLLNKSRRRSVKERVLIADLHFHIPGKVCESFITWKEPRQPSGQLHTTFVLTLYFINVLWTVMNNILIFRIKYPNRFRRFNYLLFTLNMVAMAAQKKWSLLSCFQCTSVVALLCNY